jgi:hypothetical protein
MVTIKTIEITPFIVQTAQDYDLDVQIVAHFYERYGSTPMYYESLEKYIKERNVNNTLHVKLK